MRNLILLFLCAAAFAQSVQLVEGRGGYVSISYPMPAFGDKTQQVTMKWENSNPTHPAVTVAWYPDAWYIKFNTPITPKENAPLRWNYTVGEHRAMAVATFKDGMTTSYPFVIQVKVPEPVKACAPICQDKQ